MNKIIPINNKLLIFITLKLCLLITLANAKLVANLANSAG